MNKEYPVVSVHFSVIGNNSRSKSLNDDDHYRPFEIKFVWSSAAGGAAMSSWSAISTEIVTAMNKKIETKELILIKN